MHGRRGLRMALTAACAVVLAVSALPLVAPAAAAAPPAAKAAPSAARSLRTPPPPDGTLIDHGSPISSLTVVEGAFGTLPDGQFVAYAAPMGENAELNVSSTTFPGTTTQLGRYPMPGASGDATITVAPDGSVYIGTYYEGHLYRWDPATGVMTDLGSPTAAATYLYGLSVAPDGTVYGGTYPDAHVFSYRPDAGFADLGRPVADPAVQYLRSTAYDPEHHALYVGTQPVAQLARVDLDTGTVTQLAFRPVPGANSVSDLDVTGGRLFANINGKLRVFDTATNTEVPFLDGDTQTRPTDYSIAARGVSPARENGAYFTTTYSGSTWVVRYDVTTDTLARTSVRSTRGALIGYGWQTEGGHNVLYAFAGNYSGGAFRYDIDSGAAGSMQLQISPAPSPLENVLPGADGSQVFVDAFLNGSTSRYDVAAGTATAITRIGQAESWIRVGGNIYAGTYPNGALVSLPVTATASTPLTTYAQLKDTDQQIRPLAAVADGGIVYFGTEPDYGLRGGAVVTLDPAVPTVSVARNVVQDQTIASLAVVGGKLYAGSSTEGGTGTDPLPGSAVLVKLDPATKQVLASATPVPGAESINALAEHNGHLFGLADKTLFQLDPATMRVTRTLALNAGGQPYANNGELVFHPNGYLYVNVGTTLVVVDPLAFTQRTLATGVNRLQLSADRTLWTLIQPAGFTNFLDLGQYAPAATPCANPDTRDYLTIRGVQTRIANRFLVTGCTLQDLVNGLLNKRQVATPELAKLVGQGKLSPAEFTALAKLLR